MLEHRQAALTPPEGGKSDPSGGLAGFSARRAVRGDAGASQEPRNDDRGACKAVLDRTNLGTTTLARQRLVLDPVRAVCLVAQAAPAVGLVVLVVALEPDNLAVALEGQDVGRDPI